MLLASLTWAAAPSAKKQVVFDYQLGAGADSCPSKEAMQNATAARLGYNPFGETGTLKISTEVKEEKGALRALLRVRQSASASEGKRELWSKEKDCRELAAAMQLAMVLAIDPFSSKTSDASAPTEKTEVEQQVTAPSAAPAPAPAKPETPWRVSAGLGALAAWGATPGTSLGLSIDVRALREAFSFALSGQAYLPTTSSLETYSASHSLLTMKAVPCLHRGLFAGCAVVELGALRSVAANVSQPKVAWTPHVMAGARAAFEFRLHPSVSLQAHADVLARLIQVSLLVNEKTEWASPFFAVATGASVRLQF